MPKRPSSLRAFIIRNIPGAAKGSHNDGWRSYMLSCTAKGSGNNIHEVEANWLRKNGAKGNSLGELWLSYLDSKAVPKGTLRTRIDYFLLTGSQT